MSASVFADKIIKELSNSIGTNGSNYDSSTPIKANNAISKGITDYLLENTIVTVSYSGMTTSTPPSPFITTDSCKIIGTCAPLSGNNFSSWVKSIESNITSGFFIDKGSLVVPVTPSPVFLPGLILTQSSIKSIHLDNLDNPQKPVWEKICETILNWLNSIISPPYSATTVTPPSSGISTVTKINII